MNATIDTLRIVNTRDVKWGTMGTPNLGMRYKKCMDSNPISCAFLYPDLQPHKTTDNTMSAQKVVILTGASRGKDDISA